MPSVFTVLGYGLPDDILQDESYNRYLSIVFNTIYTATIAKNNAATILLCGGNTDMKAPYTRTESGEMLRFFQKFIKDRQLEDETSGWHFFLENRSVSTLENLLLGREQIKKHGIKRQLELTIFCEYTRRTKVRFFARQIWPGQKIKLIAIDFETVPRRYIDPRVLERKEKIDMRFSAIALKNPQALKLHHRLMSEKFEHLRKLAPEYRDSYLQEWFERAEEEFGEIQNRLNHE